MTAPTRSTKQRTAIAALLVGRRIYGWRGRIALRWTITGFVFLLLAYVGSRFVLEVVLGKSA